MGSLFFYACGMLAALFPFLAVLAILCSRVVRRSRRGRNRRRGKPIPELWSSALVLGIALQFLQTIYQPSARNVLEAKYEDQVDEEDSGDPESMTKQLDRQLRRIRRGEKIDRIVVRVEGRANRASR